ncbi:protein of unknown function [Trichlorobacter ammonificans]|uniref:Uncharacterized protein n=1 Tax=Trichlorobacter ammonificans TaxID=2916410 RepID=A0ABN8HDB2_9BACT|nr:protein of unknown function [Trichlorobacter ammonificans]
MMGFPLKHTEIVSIHARPLGRALQSFFSHGFGTSFVSIHARPLGRALLMVYFTSWGDTPCFNPRPPFGTGASDEPCVTTKMSSKFQSTPALWDGRFNADAIRIGNRLI